MRGATDFIGGIATPWIVESFAASRKEGEGGWQGVIFCKETDAFQRAEMLHN
jgi:hypothetical protein